MTPAEPLPVSSAGTRRRCGAGSCGQEAVTSGVTEALAGQDAAGWHQEADLPEPRNPGAPSRLIEPAAATSRFLDIPGGRHVRLP